MFGLVFFSLFLMFYIVWLFWKKRHPPGFPPSPSVSFPLIGDSIIIGKDLPVGFKKLRER